MLQDNEDIDFASIRSSHFSSLYLLFYMLLLFLHVNNSNEFFFLPVCRHINDVLYFCVPWAPFGVFHMNQRVGQATYLGLHIVKAGRDLRRRGDNY